MLVGLGRPEIGEGPSTSVVNGFAVGLNRQIELPPAGPQRVGEQIASPPSLATCIACAYGWTDEPLHGLDASGARLGSC